MPYSEENAPEYWDKELKAAGWTRQHGFIYKSPWGALYRGPAHAWKVMKSAEQWGVQQCEDCKEISSVGGKIEHSYGCTHGDLTVKIIKLGGVAQ